MADKYKNKYRIDSTRLPNWDYGNEAAYYVTIITKKRIHYFGEIVEKKMHLSSIGKIVEEEWYKSFEMRPDMNLQMGEFIVMPDHFHGIIIIGGNEFNTLERGAKHCASTDDQTDNVNLHNSANQFGPQSKNLASIIRGFKISVTTNARIILPEYGWQRGYHDHIIRNQKSFDNISRYIINNPENW